MTRIRATCPTCGEVELRPDEIELRIVGPAVGEVSEGSSYCFDCPSCWHEINKPADDRIARLLTGGGVPTVYQDTASAVVPSRPQRVHPEGVVAGPPFTPDDLIDFHQLLDCSDWFTRLRQTC